MDFRAPIELDMNHDARYYLLEGQASLASGLHPEYLYYLCIAHIFNLCSEGSGRTL